MEIIKNPEIYLNKQVDYWRYLFREDFLGNGGNTSSLSSGTDFGVFTTGGNVDEELSEFGHPGIWRFRCATINQIAGFSSFRDSFYLGSGEFLIQLTFTSDFAAASNNLYRLNFGFSDSKTTTDNNCLYLRNNIQGSPWQINNTVGGVQEIINTNVNCDFQQWTTLKILISSDGKTAYFYINNNLVYTLIKSNIINTNSLSAIAKCVKESSNDSANRYLFDHFIFAMR